MITIYWNEKGRETIWKNIRIEPIELNEDFIRFFILPIGPIKKIPVKYTSIMICYVPSFDDSHYITYESNCGKIF